MYTCRISVTEDNAVNLDGLKYSIILSFPFCTICKYQIKKGEKKAFRKGISSVILKPYFSICYSPWARKEPLLMINNSSLPNIDHSVIL